MNVGYPDCIRRDLIEIVECDYLRKRRFLMKLPFNNNPRKTALVIMLNPSTADKVSADKTIRTVGDYIDVNRTKFKELSGVNEIAIVNLFACSDKDPSKLGALIEEYGADFVLGTVGSCRHEEHDNDLIIERAVDQDSIVLVGWGGCPRGLDEEFFNARVNKVKSILKHKPVFCVRKSDTVKHDNPLHGLCWSANLNIYPYKI